MLVDRTQVNSIQFKFLTQFRLTILLLFPTSKIPFDPRSTLLLLLSIDWGGLGYCTHCYFSGLSDSSPITTHFSYTFEHRSRWLLMMNRAHHIILFLLLIYSYFKFEDSIRFKFHYFAATLRRLGRALLYLCYFYWSIFVSLLQILILILPDVVSYSFQLISLIHNWW